jgi:hypothetical protein
MFFQMCRHFKCHVFRTVVRLTQLPIQRVQSLVCSGNFQLSASYVFPWNSVTFTGNFNLLNAENRSICPIILWGATEYWQSRKLDWGHSHKSLSGQFADYWEIRGRGLRDYHGHNSALIHIRSCTLRIITMLRFRTADGQIRKSSAT